MAYIFGHLNISSDFVFRSIVFVDCTNYHCGGAIFFNQKDASFDLSFCSFEKCSCTHPESRGGAFCVHEGLYITIDKCCFVNNQSPHAIGFSIHSNGYANYYEECNQTSEVTNTTSDHGSLYGGRKTSVNYYNNVSHFRTTQRSTWFFLRTQEKCELKYSDMFNSSSRYLFVAEYCSNGLFEKLNIIECQGSECFILNTGSSLFVYRDSIFIDTTFPTLVSGVSSFITVTSCYSNNDLSILPSINCFF